MTPVCGSRTWLDKAEKEGMQVQVSLCPAVCGGGWGVDLLTCWLGDTPRAG